jgi:hypothetical protein
VCGFPCCFSCSPPSPASALNKFMLLGAASIYQGYVTIDKEMNTLSLRDQSLCALFN